MQMEYFVHAPTEFIQTHQEQLLPGWSVPVASVLIVLQACPAALLVRTAETEQYKQQLRQQFLAFGEQISAQLWTNGYAAEMFDPATGWPMLSQPGDRRLDDVAVVRASLGYPIALQGDCLISLHPDWGSAVYPSILVSSAPPAVLEAIAQLLSDRRLPSLF